MQPNARASASASPFVLNCICAEPWYGETLVGCDSYSECVHEWYHLHCTGLEYAPTHTQEWFCRECRYLHIERNQDLKEDAFDDDYTPAVKSKTLRRKKNAVRRRKAQAVRRRR